MAMPTPQQAAQRWKEKLSASTQKMMEGVNAVQISPMEQAAARQDAYIAGVQNNVGKWAEGLRSVSLPQWKEAMQKKTVPRIASGAAAGEGKMQNFMSQFLPFEAGVVANLPQRGDTEQNILRATQVMRENAKFRYQKNR